MVRGCLYQQVCGRADGHVACSPLEVDAVKDRVKVASLDHPHCLSSRNLEDFLSSEEAGDLDLEITPVNTLEEAIESLKEGELDLLAMPARLLHGKQIKLLEAGCQVLGARTPRRPARFLVSENRIWYQPKGAIILCDDKIIRRQLKRARRGLRLLSSEAYASIHEIENRPDSEDEIALWMEKLRRNGYIDGFVTSREVFNSIHCSSRRTVLGIDPEEREGDRYLPVPYADLVVLIGRSGFPRKLIQQISELEGETVWWTQDNLIGGLSESELDRIAILVRHRQVGAIMRQAEEFFDLTMETVFHDPEGETETTEVHVEIRMEFLSDDGMQTVSVERLVPLPNLENSVIALAKDWERMLTTASSPIPEQRSRQGLLPAKEPWIDLEK